MRERIRLPDDAVVVTTQSAQLTPSCPSAKQLCQLQIAHSNLPDTSTARPRAVPAPLLVQAPNTTTAYMLELPQHVLTLLFFVLLGVISFALGPRNACLGGLQCAVKSRWRFHAFCSRLRRCVLVVGSRASHLWTARKPFCRTACLYPGSAGRSISRTWFVKWWPAGI